jgi:hypothetical protein
MNLLEALRRYPGSITCLAGMAIGIVPLLLFRSGGLTDPYDEPLSHLWWIAGFIISGGVMSFISPQSRWTLALLCGVGFATAATVMVWIEVKIAIATHNLWPFSLMFTLIYGFAVASIGAFVGKIARRSYDLDKNMRT